MTDTDYAHILTPVEAEQMLANALRRLDDMTAEHRVVQDTAAKAEADYRLAKGTKALAIIRASTAEKWSAAMRDARIEVELDEERRAHLYAQAALHSSREALVTQRTRVEALRSIGASVRTSLQG